MISNFRRTYDQFTFQPQLKFEVTLNLELAKDLTGVNVLDAEAEFGKMFVEELKKYIGEIE